MNINDNKKELLNTLDLLKENFDIMEITDYQNLMNILQFSIDIKEQDEEILLKIYELISYINKNMKAYYEGVQEKRNKKDELRLINNKIFASFLV